MFWIIIVLIFISVSLLALVLVPVFQTQTDQFLQQAETDVAVLYLEIKARQVLYLTIFASLFCALFGLLFGEGSLIMALMGAGLGTFFPKLYFSIERKKRKNTLEVQLVEAIEMMSNSLKAGTNIYQALALVPEEMPAPIKQEWNIVLRELELGLSLNQALNNLAERVQSEEYDLLVTAITIGFNSGGNLAEVFDEIARTIRERNVMLGKIKSLTAEGRMQAVFVGVLPMIMGALLFVIDPAAMEPLFASSTGHFIFGVVLVLQAIGAYFVNKITTIHV